MLVKDKKKTKKKKKGYSGGRRRGVPLTASYSIILGGVIRMTGTGRCVALSGGDVLAVFLSFCRATFPARRCPHHHRFHGSLFFPPANNSEAERAAQPAACFDADWPFTYVAQGGVTWRSERTLRCVTRHVQCVICVHCCTRRRCARDTSKQMWSHMSKCQLETRNMCAQGRFCGERRCVWLYV